MTYFAAGVVTGVVLVFGSAVGWFVYVVVYGDWSFLP